MLISKNYHVNIKKIPPPVNGIFVVVVGLPYREFPSVIILNRDTQMHRWERVFECLSPGIQNTSSGILDFHTKGIAADFALDKLTKNYVFGSEKVRKLVESSFDIKGEIIIPYQKFIHMQTADNANTADISPYTIDKTKYFDLANLLFDNVYRTYPIKQCLKYDTPLILDCKLEQKGNLYIITVKTDNNQLWVYTFKGVDAQNRYLIDKQITVSKIVH